MDKRIYLFEEGSAKQKEILGGKGGNLCEMVNIGLPVPPGFIITTGVCKEYSRLMKMPDWLMDEVKEKLKIIEGKTAKKFGDANNPLLLSVRSGAAFSMPGMMDTVLNLGLNDETVKGIISKTQNERFAYDVFRRFIMMFSDIVLDIKREKFEEVLEKTKKEKNVKYDADLSADDLKGIIEEYKKILTKEVKVDFPQDPMLQLQLSIEAVFRSWNNPRAKTYRKLNKIPDDLGTAVSVQTMVFGNRGNTSGTGVAFTRNPSTGEKVITGEFLINAQGEDVVAGIRTPLPISKLQEEMPKIFEEFIKICYLLENHYREMQDIELTVEEDKLYILQCRAGKRTAASAVKIAVDMCEEGLISREDAVLRVEPSQIDQVLHWGFDPLEVKKQKPIARGLAASPGAASGKVIFDADTAEDKRKEGEKIILVRPETCPDDIHGLAAAQGVLTARGGLTSHAAVVARGMGKPCVSGCEQIKVDVNKKIFQVDITREDKKETLTISEGNIISIDGSTGCVFLGEIPLVEPQLSEEFGKLLLWADSLRKLRIRTNADTPEDAKKAFEFGAEGVGLCRTEHMFMAEDRLPKVQIMILSETEVERKNALDKLLPMQKQDFIGIFQAMQGYPVTIRLLDPPLHEFLPKITDEEKIRELSRILKVKRGTIRSRITALHEANPMLGLRGCRLGILYPEINEMQVRAIFEAAIEVALTGQKVKPEIMIPLVGHVNELKIVREQLEKVGKEVMKEKNYTVDYSFGTMIEIPRAALTADEIAEYAEFFSFGTNDLTQTTFGYSRDDAEGKFLFYYVDKKILPDNPFQTLDTAGVGELMKIAVERGRKTRPNIKLGICGEHGGDPDSVRFCHQIGLDYVSCSPYRVPIARLAAAQANIDIKIERDK